MALDRVVRWPNGAAPRLDVLRIIAEDFFHGFVTSMESRGDWIFVTLVGGCSFARRRQEGLTTDAVRSAEAEMQTTDGQPTPRRIELWRDTSCLYVMTRQADEATNALAQGFAELCARSFDGQLETQ